MKSTCKGYIELCVFLSALIITYKVHTCYAKDKTKLINDGEIIFGGLFPMHEKGQQGDGRCGKIKKEKGIQRLEAMLFAVQRINDDQKLLPGIHIGVHILDTCSSDTYALEQCMDFIKAQITTIDNTDYYCDNGKIPQYTPIKPVVGVIGAASSTVSIMVANILRLFKVSLSIRSIKVANNLRLNKGSLFIRSIMVANNLRLNKESLSIGSIMVAYILGLFL